MQWELRVQIILKRSCVKTLLDKYGLTCGSVICFDNYTDSDPAVLLHTQAAIDATAAVGCKTLMLVAGFPDASMPREAMRENLIANLREAVQYAADRGVTVCIEDFPSTVIPNVRRRRCGRVAGRRAGPAACL